MLLYDTLAEMKAEILNFKNDQRSDYEALQKQIDDISSPLGKGNQNTSRDPNDENKVTALSLQIQESVNKIETLDTLLNRRTKRISDLENEIKVVRGENAVLRQTVELNSKDIHKVSKTSKSIQDQIAEQERQFTKWTDKYTNKHQTLISKVKELRTNENDSNRRLLSIQKQVDNLKEPEYKKLCEVKNELKCLKDKIHDINDDLDIQEKCIKENKSNVSNIKKKQAELVKDNNKLKKKYANTIQSTASSAKHQDGYNHTEHRQTTQNQTANVKDPPKISTKSTHQQQQQEKGESIPVVLSQSQPYSKKQDTQRQVNYDCNHTSQIDEFYLGNLSHTVTVITLQDFLHNKGIEVRKVHIFACKINDRNAAKLDVIRGYRSTILQTNFFPFNVYARKWYEKPIHQNGGR